MNGETLEDCRKLGNHLVCEVSPVRRAYLGYGSDDVDRTRKRKLKPRSSLPFGIELPESLKKKRKVGLGRQKLQKNDILPESRRDEGADFQFEEENHDPFPGEEPNYDENLLGHLLDQSLGY